MNYYQHTQKTILLKERNSLDSKILYRYCVESKQTGFVVLH